MTPINGPGYYWVKIVSKEGNSRWTVACYGPGSRWYFVYTPSEIEIAEIGEYLGTRPKD